jgi:hypothetical protein
MSNFQYTPDEEIQIHREEAIRLMCQPFLSHENGLPEWVKNSAAAYVRVVREPDKRIIVLSFKSRHRSEPAAIACLDFVGMTSTQIERDFRYWADPDAACRESVPDVRIGELGGHGNGGKCYMTQMFEDYSYFLTVRNRLGCKYGVKAGSVAFGYVPNSELGKDFPISSLIESLKSCLKIMQCDFASLPANIQEIASGADGFTFIYGISPRYWEEREVCQRLIEGLLSHHQMITPLQLCQIYVIVNGTPFNGGKPLELPRIDPMPGYESPRTISIPEVLRDPKSIQNISTKDESSVPSGYLKILTSEKNMRFGRGGRRQWRHTVTFHTNESGVIGKIPIISLEVESNYRDYVYGECYLESLDRFQQNNRGALAESPLTRAVENWISAQVRAFCRELEERERKIIKEQDKSELVRLNEWLDHWKNQFLQEFMQGLYGEGEGRRVIDNPPLPAGIPARIELFLTNSRAGKGVYFRPIIKFLDACSHRIRPVPFRWISEDNNVAMIDEELMLVRTFSFGATNIHAETLNGKLRSNIAPLEVVRILEIRVFPHEIEMPAGTRRKFEAICKLSDGSEVSNVYLTWMENDASVARVSSAGLVYAFSPGKTEVTATDESCRSDVPAIITVTPEAGLGEGKDRGRGFPKILISEVDCGPGEESPPVFRSDEPPVHQRLQDHDNNVWWINLASPFARYYYTNSNYGVDSEAWRMYHVERVIDIIVQIALAHGPGSEDSLASGEWIQRAAEHEADIRQKALESLKDFIINGETET